MLIDSNKKHGLPFPERRVPNKRHNKKYIMISDSKTFKNELTREQRTTIGNALEQLNRAKLGLELATEALIDVPAMDKETDLLYEACSMTQKSWDAIRKRVAELVD